MCLDTKIDLVLDCMTTVLVARTLLLLLLSAASVSSSVTLSYRQTSHFRIVKRHTRV
jgi:hypothetical protein